MTPTIPTIQDLPPQVVLFNVILDRTSRTGYSAKEFTNAPRCTWKKGRWTASVLAGGVRVTSKPQKSVREAEDCLYQQIAHMEDMVSSDFGRLQRTHIEGPESIQFMEWTLFRRNGMDLTYQIVGDEERVAEVTVHLEPYEGSPPEIRAFFSASCTLSVGRKQELEVYHTVNEGDLSSILYDLEAKVRATLLTIASSAKAIALKKPLVDHGVSQ